ncbi:MAG: hypothetical protein ACFFCM_15290, partial [Promethearchaeota archaeon]
MARLTDESLISLLKSKRVEINKRIEKIRQMQPAFDLKAVNHGIVHVIEPLIKAIKKINPEKIESVFNIVFDLLLFAIGKYYYAVSGKQFTSVRLEILFEKLLPLFPEIIVEKPSSFIGKMINAGENLREKSTEFFNILLNVSEFIKSDNYKEIGQIAAWIVGETRLRNNALDILEQSPPELTLKFARLNNISKSKAKIIANYILDVLKNDKWRSIKKPFSEEFVKLLQENQEIPKKRLNAELDKSDFLDDRSLVLLSDFANFVGFRGKFSSPPHIIWGPNGDIIGYTRFGEIIFVNIERNGYIEKSIRPRDIKVLGYNSKIGLIGVNRKGEIINLLNLEKYSEMIQGTKKFFKYCSSISTSDYVYFIHKSNEIFKIGTESIEKFTFKGDINELTVSTDDKFFFINVEKIGKSKNEYHLAELSLKGKSQNLMELKA